MDAFFSFLKVATIGIFALIALVLVLLAMPQTRLKSTLIELLAWFGFLGASGLVASPVDLIPDVLPVIGWSDDLGYALLALVCGYIGWNLRRRRLTGQPAGRQLLLPFFRETMRLWHGWRAMPEAQPLNQCQARDTGPWLMGSAIIVRAAAFCPLPSPLPGECLPDSNYGYTTYYTTNVVRRRHDDYRVAHQRVPLCRQTRLVRPLFLLNLLYVSAQLTWW